MQKQLLDNDVRIVYTYIHIQHRDPQNTRCYYCYVMVWYGMILWPCSDERPWPVRMSKQRVFREECDALGYAPGCPESPSARCCSPRHFCVFLLTLRPFELSYFILSAILLSIQITAINIFIGKYYMSNIFISTTMSSIRIFQVPADTVQHVNIQIFNNSFGLVILFGS